MWRTEEYSANARCHISMHIGQDVGVQVRRGAGSGMAHPLAHRAELCASLHSQRYVRVARVVDANARTPAFATNCR